MFDRSQLDQIVGKDAYGSDGSKIGKVGQVYLDDATEQPAWVTVNTGLFGTSETFIPVQDASFSGDRVNVPYTKEKVKDAPNVASDGHISREEEQTLYQYYGMDYGSGYSDTDTTTHTTTDTSGFRAEGHDTSGPTTDDAMTRSEEQVRVGTRSQEVGRARLRKYVVTENVTETVPVTKERAVLQTEPITDANIGNATSGPAISEEEHEVTLREEVPVVEKEVTPVERVRLGTEQVTTQETVSTDVQKERIEVEGDVDGDINRR